MITDTNKLRISERVQEMGRLLDVFVCCRGGDSRKVREGEGELVAAAALKLAPSPPLTRLLARHKKEIAFRQALVC